MTKSRFKKALDPPALDMGTEQTRKRLKPDPIVSAAQKWRKANMRDAPALEASAREIRRIYQMVASGQLVRATDLSEVKTHGIHVNEWLAQRRRDLYIPWSKLVGQGMDIFVDWQIMDVPLIQCDRKLRKRNGYTSDLVERSLTLYSVMSGVIKKDPRL